MVRRVRGCLLLSQTAQGNSLAAETSKSLAAETESTAMLDSLSAVADSNVVLRAVFDQILEIQETGAPPGSWHFPWRTKPQNLKFSKCAEKN